MKIFLLVLCGLFTFSLLCFVLYSFNEYIKFGKLQIGDSVIAHSQIDSEFGDTTAMTKYIQIDNIGISPCGKTIWIHLTTGERFSYREFKESIYLI